MGWGLGWGIPNPISIRTTAFTEPNAPYFSSRVLFWSTVDFEPDSTSASPASKYVTLGENISFPIADDGERMIFRNHHDWVCSVDRRSNNPEKYRRHFFFPADWLSGNTDFLCQVGQRGEIVFAHRDKVSVIKRGLNNIEPDQHEAPKKQMSLLKKMRTHSE